MKSELWGAARGRSSLLRGRLELEGTGNRKRPGCHRRSGETLCGGPAVLRPLLQRLRQRDEVRWIDRRLALNLGAWLGILYHAEQHGDRARGALSDRALRRQAAWIAAARAGRLREHLCQSAMRGTIPSAFVDTSPTSSR